MPNIYPNSQPQPYYGVNGKLTDDAKALPVPKKVFILDKSVLLYSPYAVFAFDEHTIVVPFNVIRDLDAIKKSQGESSRNAQEALSIIETLREKGNLRCGVPLENGGMFFVDDSSNETLLESAYSCMRHCPKESEIIVVSNSIATRIRMEESGFKAEVYRSDSVMTDSTSQAQSSTTSSSSTETTPAGENWSLLDHLPEWAEGTVTPAVTTDPNSGILFGENPLNDVDWTKSLSLDEAPNFNGVTVSVEELKTLPINGYMALNREDEGYSIKGTSEEYDAEEEIDRDIQDYCVTGEEGNYYQIGSYATDGSYAMMLNEDIAKEENMTFGDAFDKGLYYSRINVYDFDWFPAYDSTAQEKFKALYEHFGNPSGLYWKTTTFGGMTFSSFDELKAATYEDVGEAKSYWLVWNCDGYTLAAECYDQFDGKEAPQETSVTSICVFPDADESYISHVDAGSVVDGYVGCGEAPLCLSGIKTEG